MCKCKCDTPEEGVLLDEDFIAVPVSYYEELIREVLASGGEFRLYPHGTSMLPLIRQGRDSVALRQLDRPAQALDILFNQRDDGSFILHRVKEVTPEGLTLWGDNQIMLEHGVTENQIIGYAARVFRSEREINLEGLYYRAYLWLWKKPILRRMILTVLWQVRKLHK